MALSNLHDDLLRRILYFTPAKEGACTSALARRWRYLWLSSGAVNLDSSPYSYGVHDEHSSKGNVGRWRYLWLSSGPVDLDSFPYSYGVHDEHSSKGNAMRAAFLRSAEAALAASRCGPIKRLTFHLEGQLKKEWRVRQADSIYKVLDVMLANPAARGIEELGVTVSNSHLPDVRRPNINPGALTFESLRVLDVSMCQFQWQQTQAELALPRLEAMCLHQCDVRAVDLQSMINAAPLLTILKLYEVKLVDSCKRIRCPRVTNLVLADLDWRESSTVRGGMELDAPMLRSFRYRGFIRRFLLESPATTEIANAYLQFVGDNENRQRHDVMCRLFWQFVNNFSNVKTLKLKLVHLEHIIVADKRMSAKLYTLGGDTVFRNLHLLDLQAFYTPGRKAGGVAFDTFLRCCPMISVLHLELSTVDDGDPSRSASHVQDYFLDEEEKLDLCKSSVDKLLCP